VKRWWAPVGLALGIAPSVQGQIPSGVTGEWWTPGFGARVRIEPCGDAVCGRIVWLWDETPKDIADKNPLVGRAVIERMQPAEPGFWRGGRLYNPEDGRDYKGSLQLQAPNRLVVDGCVLFICRTQVWRRADSSRCPPVAPADARGAPE
jgi:uncharacterized protein (DUF2147 family)